MLLAGLWLVPLADAWALRCGNSLVSENDSTQRLVQVCGEPTRIEKLEERRAVRVFDRHVNEYVTVFETVPYEVWTYNFGPRRFISRITVRNGVIRHIESGGYGF